MSAVDPRATGSVENLQRIERLFLDAERQLNARLNDILNRGPEWFREEARLRRLLDASRAAMADLREAFDEEALARGLGEVYAEGATAQEGVLGKAFDWSQPHLGAVDRIANDTFEDLLTATKYVEDSVKQTIRQAARLNTGRKLTTGKTAVQAGNALAKQLRASGIGIVTYRNGARHGVGEYSRMVLRTKTAVAYNVGTLNHSIAAGGRFFEIFDGSDCGLSHHNDPTLANGLVVPADIAAAFAIAHPNCRRSFGARPDVNRLPGNAPQFAPSTTAAQRADQAAFEKFLREQQGRKKIARAPRKATAPKAPRPARRPRNEPPPRPAPRPEPPPPAPEPRPKPSPKREPRPRSKPRPAETPRRRAPGTQKVGDQFEYDSDAAKLYKPVADQIDELVGAREAFDPLTGLRDLQMENKLRVSWERQSSGQGGYFSARDKVTPKPRRRRGESYSSFADRTIAWRKEEGIPRIVINGSTVRRKEELQSFYFAHEIGHRLDYMGVRRDGGFLRHAMWTEQPLSVVEEIGGVAQRRALEGFIEAVQSTESWPLLKQAALRGGMKQYQYVTSTREVWARAFAQWTSDRIGGDIRVGMELFRSRNAVGYQWSPEEFERISPWVEEILRTRGMMT